MNNVIETIEQQQLKEGQPDFRAGDALRIHRHQRRAASSV